MTTLNSLTRRLDRLEAATRAKLVPPAPDYAVIFYDSHRPDKDAWIEAEQARILEQGAGHIRTLFILPEKETLEENAARYAVYRE